MSPGKRPPFVRGELPSRLEKVSEIEHAAGVVPSGVAHRVVPHRVEDPLVGFALTSSAIGGGRPVRQLVGKRGVAQRVVQVRRLEPAPAFSRRYVHGVRPLGDQAGDPLDMRPPFR